MGGVAVALRATGKTSFYNYGVADAARQQPITPDSIFNLASVGKLFATNGASIALAYVPRESAEPGTELAVDIFGEWVPAEVRAEPLYDPKGQRVRA